MAFNCLLKWPIVNNKYLFLFSKNKCMRIYIWNFLPIFIHCICRWVFECRVIIIKRRIPLIHFSKPQVWYLTFSIKTMMLQFGKDSNVGQFSPQILKIWPQERVSELLSPIPNLLYWIHLASIMKTSSPFQQSKAQLL